MKNILRKENRILSLLCSAKVQKEMSVVGSLSLKGIEKKLAELFPIIWRPSSASFCCLREKRELNITVISFCLASVDYRLASQKE